ncbi:MAG: outer membrane lipid asymmetry maintenance protein MlaD [Proteobacteria bacterium]|jgi:phospholipid/cholesterol/gamma-HCH transport system substrate-binding protein|nr:outer membrane lipid asymmetry maintenance protein MlaD [Alphaproteobacteria bacterium]MDA0307245.1 outer membrane lipid asymmetry maintenance protein MlaD [Pseudomonadota bacterium]MDA0908773.1 outer membrane lipid asymmetry maintenance protein MlaD [Pseudomonadota bacterium]MDA1320121.1 outer membrane lipid asymmetry maintenance protein MlaD [Pseudomonadota bacterium]
MRNTIEMVMGAVVLIIAGAFLWLALSITNFKPNDTITVEAVFGKIGDLKVGDDVRISGIAIGSVSSTRLDPEIFDAYVEMAIDPSYAIPDDSVVRISSTSLLGGSHVDVVPGNSMDTIAEGHVFYNTLDPINLADLIGKAVFSSDQTGE